MQWGPLEESWLDAICELWNRELGQHFPMRKELFMQNCFRDVNVYAPASRIVRDDAGELCGFIVAKQWQESTYDVQYGEGSGWIQALVVRADTRNKGLGGQLLLHAEASLREAGVERIYLGRDPWHFFPGVPKALSHTRPWMERRGYTALYDVHDLVATYHKNEHIVEPTVAEDIQLRLLDHTDKDKMIAFFRACFPGRWAYEALRYWELNGSGREFIGLVKGEQMIGFCRVNDARSPFIAQNTYWAPSFDEELGGIGPLGVDPAYRGQGLGVALVEAGVAELRRRGLTSIVIDWTELVDFYAKFGFQPWKSYDLMVKSFK
ncbi:GNAT family N-acetyltransferase [Paenibacillus sp. 481]|uniref:GNAT family N-acetyltransferase n=1 Tax=Paenibacillus sp. 481 TaxID=2835869 RepID=UPI001E2A4B02|nr:GNAT family N-acetyltransferase [Paenibacillus sp. 481]UHA73973.1 GNAT family N-acetyltransferase [Paenibacillus sp. 481]